VEDVVEWTLEAGFSANLEVLTGRERRVLALVLNGASSKRIAIEVGISEAQVSRLLASAASTLGLRSRADLVRFAAGQNAAVTSLPAELTVAERAVLQLIVEGRSNEEIAALRGSSRTTVANQVSALLRKTGACNRRGLMVAFCKAAWDQCA
jgi:DNA-binding CsgD family transcriptional regulator